MAGVSVSGEHFVCNKCVFQDHENVYMESEPDERCSVIGVTVAFFEMTHEVVFMGGCHFGAHSCARYLREVLSFEFK